MICNAYFVLAQNVVEVKRIELSKEFNETLKKAIQYKDSSIYKKIENLENGLINAKSQYEKYRIIVNTLGSYYTLTKQYDKAIDLWFAANEEGLFFPFDLKDKGYLPYIQEYSDNKRFMDFLAMNDTLKKKANANSKMEYFVNLPTNYKTNVKYPLIIVLHGGSGNNNTAYYSWESKTINNTFISVYPQGKEIAGSYASYYGQTGVNDITEVYKQVITKYSVDTSTVILAGQSDGGNFAVRLAYNNIPAKGLLLAFPVKPEDFDYAKASEFKHRNVRIIMICGQKDKEYFPGQQEMSNILDSAKVENRFIKYPDLSHGFPPDFSEQLDKGLQYLIKNEN
jgi:predicted esterase